MTDIFSLDEKVIMVVGGAGLIGDDICRTLDELGAKVVVADGNKEGAKSLADSLEDADSIEVDVTKQMAVKELFQTVSERHGGFDAVVNTTYPRTENYGRKFQDVEYEDWRTHIDIHLNSYYLVSATAALELLDTGSTGSIVNIASIYGMQAPDFTVYEGIEMTSPIEYATIKGGILNLTRYLASYLGPDSIRVNAVSPGGVFDDQQESFVERYERRTPLGRMAEPEDISGAVAYLVSDAASYTTGHNLVVDGGWTIK